MTGFIQAKILTGGSENEFGEPIEPASGWGNLVECKYVPNNSIKRGKYINGEFSITSYSITTDTISFDASVLRLLDSRENIVCEKEVQSIEFLESIQRVKITI